MGSGEIMLAIISVSYTHLVFGYISYCLPFQAMYYTPSGIYTGIINGQQEILIYMLVQLLWITFLLFVIKLMWKKAEKRIAILGG